MVAARRQRQAQKLQEQQISKALAEPNAISNHVSFGDDDDDENDGIDQAAGSGTTANGSAGATGQAEQDSDDDDDDDAPIEEVSTKTSRKQAEQDSARLKTQEKAEKAKRQASEAKRIQRKKENTNMSRKLHQDAVEPAPSRSAEDEEESSGDDNAGSSNRLDPSLFAQVFSQPVSAPKSILKKRSAAEQADEVAQLQRERKLRRKQQRAGGIVKGRDGLPMKQTEGGIILRALNASATQHKKSFDEEDDDEPHEPLDTVVRPTRLDPSASLPNAKVRSFKKRTLGKKRPSPKAPSSKDQPKSTKSEDDPLGLNDPAFLPGGEFYHLVNKRDKAKPKQTRKDTAATPRQAYRGGGVRKDAVAVLRARSRGGPSLGFARSQDDDDDY